MGSPRFIFTSAPTVEESVDMDGGFIQKRTTTEILNITGTTSHGLRENGV